jgi:alpha-L-arabinofuranosidase
VAPPLLKETHSFDDALKLKHDDLKAVNSKDRPNEVAPRQLADVSVGESSIRAVLKPLSWNILVTRGSDRLGEASERSNRTVGAA